ncbi:MAG TPA: GntP family permease [Clostridiales bacterium]|jgi:H+/gluconate symporter-like permease|nr:GntP family permease [Clostridiales bacterium]
MQVILMILGLALVMVLIFRGVPIFFTALIASLFIVVTTAILTTAQINLSQIMITEFVNGIAGYFGSYFWLFILGAIFGKLFEVSGAADSIATGIINKLGEKAIVPAIILAGFLLSYGGVSVFVAFFAMYPLMLSMFKKADITRHLLPALYFAGAGTATGMMPGSPAAHNIIPTQFLGVKTTAAFVPGMIAAAFEMVLVFIWIYYCVRRAKKQGKHFEATAADEEAMKSRAGKKLPNFWLSLVPMVILLVLLNGTSLGVAPSLAGGIVAALICFYKTIDWKNVWGILSSGTTGGLITLFNTAAIVGFGTVVKVMPAFTIMTDAITKIGGSPLVSASIAVGLIAGITGSGTGGQGIALPVVKTNYIDTGLITTSAQLEGLARCVSIAALTLDSLPHCGLVVSVINYTGNTHKTSYIAAGVTNVVIPIITLCLLIPLCYVFGYA